MGRKANPNGAKVMVSVSIDPDMLPKLDAEVARVLKLTGYEVSRCEVIRSLLRKALGEKR